MNKRQISAELVGWKMPRPLVAIIAEYAEAPQCERLCTYVCELRKKGSSWSMGMGSSYPFAVMFSNPSIIVCCVAERIAVAGTSRFCACVLRGGVEAGHRDANNSVIKKCFEALSCKMLADIE